MVEPTEQLGLKFPAGTRARLKALAQEGESMTAVILRAVAVLEGHGADARPEQDQPHDARLEAIEARLETLEAMLAPAEGSGPDYPEVIRAGAVKLHEAGRSTAEVRRAIEDANGRAPSMKHMTKTLRRWSAQIGGQAGADD